MYILECADGSYYTGSTKDLELRFKQHQNGNGANHTKARLPVKLVYFEEFKRIDEAFYREKQVQGWRRDKKEALINNQPEKLHELARCLNETHSGGFDFAQPPMDFAQPPMDFAQPPIEIAQPPMEIAQPPMDFAQPPVDETCRMSHCLSRCLSRCLSHCLSEVEGSVDSAQPHIDETRCLRRCLSRCLSEVEGSIKKKKP